VAHLDGAVRDPQKGTGGGVSGRIEASRRHRGSIRAGRNGASASPPARLAPAQEGEDIPDGLDWDAFSTHYFPGRRRHDLEVISAYAAYQQR
jgi:hypothetical protein